MNTVFDTPRILDAPKTGKTISRATKDRRTKEARAITMLVEMDKRRKLCLGAGDRDGLIELAGEYALINCPNTASQIIIESENL